MVDVESGGRSTIDKSRAIPFALLYNPLFTSMHISSLDPHPFGLDTPN